jgi:L-ribulose-5-phosphate 3-epimerase
MGPFAQEASMFKIGIILPSLRLPWQDGLAKAAELGADGVQVWTAGGELDPANLDAAGKRELRAALARHGLEISALCADYGKSFGDAAQTGFLIETMKRQIDFAAELGVYAITTHIGVIPEDRAAPEWRTMQQAMGVIGAYGDAHHVCLATVPGPEEPRLMREFFETVPNTGIKVNYDPANLAMAGYDHLAGVSELRNYIVHTHAKDGLRVAGSAKEVPLGEGAVRWPEYLAALKQTGRDLYLTIEREVGDDPVRDIAKAIAFLKPLIGRRG